jgi:acetoin:2,6-dichlorophenolindophenol oxidoreductase subunit alpha
MDLQECFRRMCLTRYFDLQVAAAYDQQLIPGPIYLSVGQEASSAAISLLTAGSAVFGQHRGHSVYLAYGGSPEVLRDELLGLESGCCRGRGGSPCVQDTRLPMYGHHGLIGENIPLATGYCLAGRKPTVAYFGDAAAEEDYALSPFGLAATHGLPILYVCEDNDLSILTPIRDRRSWAVADVAAAMGLAAAAIEDDPRTIYDTVQALLARLPAFVNIKTCRHRWHTGTGVDGPPRQDRLSLFRSQVSGAESIEEQVRESMEGLWQGHLQKR